MNERSIASHSWPADASGRINGRINPYHQEEQMKSKRAKKYEPQEEWYSSLVEQGRADLSAWERAQPENFYETDGHLQNILEFYWGAARLRRHAKRLSGFGSDAARIVDIAVQMA